MKSRIALPALILCLLVSVSLSAETPYLTVPLVTEPPTVDGRPEEAQWQSAQCVCPFGNDKDGSPPKAQTRAWLLRTEDALFVAFECTEPNVKAIAAQYEEHDGELWRDDCVEVFLVPDPDGALYYHYIVNSRGAVYDATAGNASNPKWNGTALAKAVVGEGKWSVEIRIPFSDLGGKPKPGQVWKMNLCRERKPVTELSTWACTGGRFLNPEAFGRIAFAPAPLVVESMSAGQVRFGLNRLSTLLRNPTQKKLIVRTALRVQARSGAAEYESKPVEIPAGGNASIVLPFAVDEGGDLLVIGSVLLDGELYRRTFRASVAHSGGLVTLHEQVDELDAALKCVPDDSPIRKSLSGLHERASSLMKEGARAREALVESPTGESGKALEKAVDEARRISPQIASLAHVCWWKSPWLDFRRDELPDSVDSISELTVDAGINEYESVAFLVTNLLSRPYHARVKVSDFSEDPFACMARLPEDSNLVKNASFETRRGGFAANWQISNRGGSARLEEIDGSECVIIGNAQHGTISVRQNLALEAGHRYLLCARVRAMDYAGSSGRIYVINSGWTWATGVSIPPGGRDWTDVALSFVAPESPAYQVVLWLPNKCPGSFAVSDVFVAEAGTIRTEVPQPEDVVLRSPEFVRLRTMQTVADPLPEMSQARVITLPPGETRQVWITLKTTGMTPGEYVSTVSLVPLDACNIRPSSASLKLKLRVKPFRLADFPRIAVYNWDYARDEAYVRDLAAHKVRNYLIGTGLPLPPFADDGTPKAEMDFSGYDRMLRIKLEHAKRNGGQIVFSYGILRDFQKRVSRLYGWDYLDPSWRKAFEYVFTTWVAHLKTLGLHYDEYAVQLWDEATGPENTGRVVEGGEFIRQLDPKVRTVMDGAQNLEEARAMDPYVDLWVPHLSVLPPRRAGTELLDFYKATGKPVWCYTCRTNMKAQPPYDYHRLKPWRAYSLGLDGVCYWAYNSWRGDPWYDFDGPIGDCGAVYDGPHGPITSRRWEASREGLEDVQYLEMLDSALARAEAAGEPREMTAKLRAAKADVIRQVLDNADKPDEIESRRLALSNMLVMLREKQSPKLGNVEVTQSVGRVRCWFTSDQPCEGRFTWLVKGETQWRHTALRRDTRHELEIPLPPEAKLGRCWLVVWNDWGAVTALDPVGEDQRRDKSLP